MSTAIDILQKHYADLDYKKRNLLSRLDGVIDELNRLELTGGYSESFVDRAIEHYGKHLKQLAKRFMSRASDLDWSMREIETAISQLGGIALAPVEIESIVRVNLFK